MRGSHSFFILILPLIACGGGTAAIPDSPDREALEAPPPPGSFGHDLVFLEEHIEDLIVLEADGGAARVAVAPTYQGRVMTSTGGASHGASFGWINRELIASGERRPHMNAFGGEDRFWLGPEGSRFSLYFAPDAPMDLEHWQVPEALDWGAWEVVGQTTSEVSFRKEMTLRNYVGTEMRIRVDRTVRIFDRASIIEHLGVPLPDDVEVVGYESINIIENIGDTAWARSRGLPSIWILGMYNPSSKATVVIPYTPGSEEQLGPVVNDAYFGEVPRDRLRVGDQAVFFRADGDARGKIGIGPRRAQPTLGAWDAERGALTLVEYTLPERDEDVYVNSLWDPEAPPYEGDAANSYNDGPAAPGAEPLGPFYELESSSPAAALAPGETLRHVHRTTHLRGSGGAVGLVAETHLGVGTFAIEDAFLDD